jgi:hypothetical protein
VDKSDDGLTGPPVSRRQHEPPRKREQVHEAAIALQRGDADRLGSDAELLAEADGGEAVA